jgi:hypothetical protein
MSALLSKADIDLRRCVAAQCDVCRRSCLASNPLHGPVANRSKVDPADKIRTERFSGAHCGPSVAKYRRSIQSRPPDWIRISALVLLSVSTVFETVRWFGLPMKILAAGLPRLARSGFILRSPRRVSRKREFSWIRPETFGSSHPKKFEHRSPETIGDEKSPRLAGLSHLKKEIL